MEIFGILSYNYHEYIFKTFDGGKLNELLLICESFVKVGFFSITSDEAGEPGRTKAHRLLLCRQAVIVTARGITFFVPVRNGMSHETWAVQVVIRVFIREVSCINNE